MIKLTIKDKATGYVYLQRYLSEINAIRTVDDGFVMGLWDEPENLQVIQETMTKKQADEVELLRKSDGFITKPLVDTMDNIDGQVIMRAE